MSHGGEGSAAKWNCGDNMDYVEKVLVQFCFTEGN